MRRAGPLTSLIDHFPHKRIAVIGDLIADEFVHGHVPRVSREAPVLILSHDSTTLTAGGAGNAASNLTALSATAILVGIIGDDDIGSSVAGRLSTWGRAA